VAKGERSLDQLIQLAISVYYNWDINNREKDKRQDLIAASHPTGAYILNLLPLLLTGGALPQGMEKGGTAWQTAPLPTGTLPSLQR
jgi:hypothetical protein